MLDPYVHAHALWSNVGQTDLIVVVVIERVVVVDVLWEYLGF